MQRGFPKASGSTFLSCVWDDWVLGILSELLKSLNMSVFVIHAEPVRQFQHYRNSAIVKSTPSKEVVVTVKKARELIGQ
jgi:hypothetical protein